MTKHNTAAGVLGDGEAWEKVARDVVANPRPIEEIKADIASVMKRIDGADLPDAAARLMLSAAASSGDAGALRLAAQLAGVPPCEGCGYRKEFCRCAVGVAGALKENDRG